MSSTTPPGRSSPRWRRWPAWVGYAAALWSLADGAAGAYWALGGSGFPFGVGHDRAAHLSVLGGLRRETGAPAIAAIGLAGAVLALAMARGRGRGAARAAMLGAAWTAAVALALVIPDFRVLVVVAYAPILLLGAPFGTLEGVRLSEAIPWPVANQGICLAGGALWSAAAIAYQRRTRGACPYCGRTDADAGWTTPRSAARWGRWAVRVAVAVPLLYALSRWAWALGFPLGITDEFYRQGRAVGLWWRGAALATLAAAGALLTLGLVRRWGEVFPRRLPLLGGRRVPPALAVVPATMMAVIVTTAGLMFVRVAITGTFSIGGNPITLRENLGALAPELLWPLWGVALGAAALAYHYRRRGRCGYCGRGGRAAAPLGEEAESD
jgi:hypothetical protein